MGEDQAAQDSVPRTRYHAQFITDHAPLPKAHRPGARAPASMGGWINSRTGSPGSEGMVPEAVAWTGFASKTPAVGHSLSDFSGQADLQLAAGPTLAADAPRLMTCQR